MSPSAPATTAIPPTKNRPARPFWPIGFFLLLSIAIAAIWHFATAAHEATVLKERQRELLAITELKIEHIRYWLEERRSEAKLSATTPTLARGVRYRPQEATQGIGEAAAIAARLEDIRQAHGHEAVLLFDAQARPGLSAGTPAEVAHMQAAEPARAAMLKNEIVISDFYALSSDGQHVDIDVVAPISADGKGGRQIIGALALHIDPNLHLYPLLRQWPSHSETAESFLAGRQGNDVVYLSPLRHSKEIGFRRPVSENFLPAAMAARGERGITEGVDYRGAKVLAAIGQVPGTSWILVAKVDRDEVMAPVRRQTLWSGALTAGLVLALGIATLLWWRQQQAEYRLAEQEGIDGALRAGEARFRKLLEHAWDFHALFDRNMIIRYSSPSISRYLGYEATGQGIGVGTANVHPDDVARVEETRQCALRQPGVPQRVEHRLSRRDGGWLTMEAYFTNHFDDPDIGALSYTARDLSSRIEAERLLVESEHTLRTFLDAAPGVSAVMQKDGTILVANEATARALGQTPASLTGKNVFDLMPPGIVSRRRHWLARVASERRPMRFEDNTGGRWFEHHAIPVIGAGGEVASVAWVAIEVTEQKQAEQQRLEFARQQRDTLVREVHHRIKNHLQGLVGLLRQHMRSQPEMKEHLDQVAAQVNAIAIVHGLQSRGSMGEVRVDSLVREIVDFLRSLTTLTLEIVFPDTACPCSINEEEAIPMALIVNELITNAIRHHGSPEAGQPIRITAEWDETGASVRVRNPGDYPAGFDFAAGKGLGTGLTLIRSLLSPQGASLTFSAVEGGGIEVKLALVMPVLSCSAG